MQSFRIYERVEVCDNLNEDNLHVNTNFNREKNITSGKNLPFMVMIWHETIISNEVFMDMIHFYTKN